MSNWSRNEIIYISETEINGIPAGSTLITDTQDSLDPFNPMQVAVTVKEIANVLTPCVISIGTNSPNYDNIVSLKTIGGALGLTLLELGPNVHSIPPATNMYCKVNVGAVGLGAVLKFKVAIAGWDVEF